MENEELLNPMEVDLTELEAENADAFVEHIDWRTGANGRIEPVAILTSPVLLEEYSIARVSCHDARYVAEHGLGNGAQVSVTLTYDGIPQVVEVLKTGRPQSLPVQCPACSAPTDMSGCYLICSSNGCPSKARTAIYRLLELAGMPRGLEEATVEDWLNRLPVNHATSHVGGIVAFIALFRQVGGKGTAARGDLLRKTFNAHFGSLLFQLESNIDKLLKEGLENWQFWYVLNLPFVTKENSQRLARYSPDDIEFMILNFVAKFSEADTIGEAIRDNSAYWKQLAPLLKLKSYSSNINALEEVFDYGRSRSIES